MKTLSELLKEATQIKEIKSIVESKQSEISGLLEEATYSGRAWSGKLSRIDKLLAWMYDKGILTKGDMNKKDTVFRAYYRYYNDGDFPGALIKQDITKYSHREEIEAALEQYLESFIKTLLAKYMPKVNRKQFRLDELLTNLKTVKNSSDSQRLSDYWVKQVNFTKELDEFSPKFKERITEYYNAEQELTKELNKVLGDKDKNYYPSYRYEQNKDLMTPAVNKAYIKLVGASEDVSQICQLLIKSIEMLKNELTK